MPGWAWAVVVVAAVVIVAGLVLQALRARRTRALRQRFGPEYDRTVSGSESRREAEAELAARTERREALDIRPLPAAARDRYVREWSRVQERFVDDPSGAAYDADSLIRAVMSDRGYPTQDFEQRAADVSVDHPAVVENYREAHRLTRAGDAGAGSTENLRRAMRHYRALFEELVDETADEPVARDDARSDERALR